MTLTSPPSGLFKITPDDGTIYAFQINKAPEFGNVQEHDLGQTVARSEGTKLYVFGKSIETNVYRFRLQSLTTHEFDYLRLYVQDQIKGSLEPATFEWGRARNRIAYSTTVSARTSDIFEGWGFSGAPLPTGSDNATTGPEGFALSASTLTFNGTTAANVVFCPDILDDFGTAPTGFTSWSWMSKVTDGGGDFLMGAGFVSGGSVVTVPDDGAWHLFEDSTNTNTTNTFRFYNGENGPRTVGLARVMITWHPDHAERHTFYDPVPFHSISNARYVPGSFQGQQTQHDMWNVELLVREEVA